MTVELTVRGRDGTSSSATSRGIKVYTNGKCGY